MTLEDRSEDASEGRRRWDPSGPVNCSVAAVAGAFLVTGSLPLAIVAAVTAVAVLLAMFVLAPWMRT